MANSPAKAVTFDREVLEALRKASDASGLTANEIVRRGTIRQLAEMGVSVESESEIKHGGRRVRRENQNSPS